MRYALSLTLGLFLLGASPSANAYPTSIIFAPTGEAKPFGQVGVLFYTSIGLAPTVAPGTTWLGINGGIVPAFTYGNGIGFGGLEVGLDVLTPWTYPGSAAIVKPVMNVKAQVLTEKGWLPHVAVGAMQLVPSTRSMNFLYASATKTIGFSEGGPVYGRITLGLGYAATSDKALFADTGAVSTGRTAFLVGYESPAWHRLSIAVDHIGGVSELSSTYGAIVATPVPSVNLGLGGYMLNDGSGGGAHGYVTVTHTLGE